MQIRDANNNPMKQYGTDNAGWVTDRSKYEVVDVENRRAMVNSVAVTDLAIVNAAAPTVADGSDLIAWTGFTNSPKVISAMSCYPLSSATPVLGWIGAVNMTAGNAGAAINSALAITNVADANATPVHADTTVSGLFFIPIDTKGRVWSKAFSDVITTVHIVPVSLSTTATNSDSILWCEFTPFPTAS